LNTRISEVTLEILTKIDTDLNITGTLDPNCKEVWFPLGIKKGYASVTEPAHTFISTQGRMKYLKPVYQALIDSDQHALAVTWYNENKDFYHPYAVLMLAKMLGISEDSHAPLV